MDLAAVSVGLTRQACERCRKHKLRCSRADNAAACTRCLRKGSQCTYSASLPKGRRSTNTGSRPHARTSSIAGDSQAGTCDDFTLGITYQSTRTPSIVSDGFQFDIGAEAGPMMTQHSFDWPAAVDSALCDILTPGTSPFSGTQDGMSKQMKFTDCAASVCSTTMDESNENLGDPEVLIARLAQLSTQISSLRRSVYHICRSSAWSSSPSFDNTQQDCRTPTGQLPFIEDGVFQSVAMWLARGPADSTPFCSQSKSHTCWAQSPKTKTLGDLLYNLFSASHHLLELLRLVQLSAVHNPNIADARFGAHFMDGHAASNNDGSPTLSRTSSCSTPFASSNNVIRHLLIAIHTMLLGIYSEVLGVLQSGATTSVTDRNGPMGDIRLISVVQLCSFLIERQHQGVALYLSSCTDRLPEPETSSDAKTTEVMKAMRTETQQRIQCLQQTLRI